MGAARGQAPFIGSRTGRGHGNFDAAYGDVNQRSDFQELEADSAAGGVVVSIRLFCWLGFGQPTRDRSPAPNRKPADVAAPAGISEPQWHGTRY